MADLGLSLTGVAGPEDHGGKEPGTVWIALDAESRTHARGFRVTAANAEDDDASRE